jgi:DNA-binding GntR family transcriptional regulator
MSSAKEKTVESKPAVAGRRGAIPRSKLAHQILSRLRDDIIQGKWAPGESLPSHVLAAELGVSHIPIREAFLALESEGFITLAPNRMPIVTEPSVEETHDKLVLLHTLEGLAAELAAKTATQEEVDQLYRLDKELDQAFDAKDLPGFHLKNLEFHRAIVLAAHNQTLADFHQILTNHLEWARVRSRIRHMLLPDTPRQHAAILDSIARRDTAAARRAMEQHSESFGSVLMHRVEERAEHK